MMHIARAEILVLVILAIPDTHSCDPEVVETAASDGFLKYVITECLDINSDGWNWVGEQVLLETECMTNWILTHRSEAHPIPDSGICRQAFQSLVSGAVRNWLGANHDIRSSGGCSYDAKTNVLDVTYGCWLSMEVELREFRRTSGSYIVTNPCNVYELREMTYQNAYDYLVQDALSLVPLGATELVPEESSMCFGCYEWFSEQLSPYTAGSSDAVESCSTDPSSAACRYSTMIENALAEFKQCTGGYEIDFVGPVCSPAEVATISALQPNPYYALTHCAFPNNDKFCSDIDTYFAAIQDQSNDKCVYCYIELSENVKRAAATSDQTVEECSGKKNGVFNDMCIALLAEALTRFMSCTGVRLDIHANAAILTVS